MPCWLLEVMFSQHLFPKHQKAKHQEGAQELLMGWGILRPNINGIVLFNPAFNGCSLYFVQCLWSERNAVLSVIIV